MNDAFLDLARRDPARVRVVDSSGARSATAAQVFGELADLFPWMADAATCDEAYFSVLDDKRALQAWLDRPAGSGACAEGSARA